MASVSPSSSDAVSLQNHYSKAYRDLEQAKDAELKREQKQNEQNLKQLESSYQNTMNRKEEEASRITDAIRNESAESNALERQKARENLEQLQRESYNSRGQLASAIPLAEHQKKLEEAYETSEKRHQSDLSNSTTREDDLKQLIRNVRKQSNEDMSKLQERHEKKISEIAEDTKLRTINENFETNKKIEDMNNFVRAEERNQKGETKRVEEAYSHYIDDMKKNLEEKESHSRDQLRTTLGEKDKFLASNLARQNSESRQSLKDLEKTYSTQIDQLNEERKNQDRTAAARLRSTKQDDQDTLKNTLQKQAEAHEIDRQNLSDMNHAHYQQLEEDYNKKAHPTQVEDIPPELENKIRQGVIGQYEKTLNTEVERNKLAQDSLASTYGSHYRQALEKAGDHETKILKEHEMEKTHDRAQFYDTLANTQQEAETRGRDKDSAYLLQVEKLQRKFAYAMERQKHEYDTIIDGMRGSSEAKIMSVREEDSRAAKQALKNLSEKQSEIFRDYDRKLSEQREQYEYMIEDIKTQTKTENREIERRSKQDLEIQAKTYEQKIAQIDEQNKEHERYISQGYQEQLEKLKRSYELTSQQKKS